MKYYILLYSLKFTKKIKSSNIQYNNNYFKIYKNQN